MPSIEETAYPRLKSSFSELELDGVYTPTPEELKWMKPFVKGDTAKLGYLILLKTSQRLGYFIPITEVPLQIIKHIAHSASITSVSLDELKSYHESGTRKRHHALIREYRKVHFFNENARQIMLDTMIKASRVKDEPADLINDAIEELIRQRFELPVFNTLKEAAKRIRSKSYHMIYEQIYHSIKKEDRNVIDQLFQTVPNSTYSPWNDLKQDAKSPTLTHLKELIAQRDWLVNQKINTQVLKEVPLSKIKQMAAEAKTLDAPRMKKLEPKKRYSLAIALISVQLTQVLDNIGEMLIKRMMSIHKKGRQHLKDYKDRTQKRTDQLVTTLLDLLSAYQTEGAAEERISAMEKVIGDRSEQVLKECETHLAFSGDNYYVFLWRFYKNYRSTLFKILETVPFRSTNQDKMLEQAISFLQSHQHSRKEWIPVVHINKKGEGKKDWEITPILDLSWIPDSWWRWISPRRKREPIPEEINRRHLEVCVFSHIMWDLKSGDLYIDGSEKYADYRKQLISWEEYEQNLNEFCEQVNLPTSGSEFVTKTKDQFKKVAEETDVSFPRNEHVRIENGEVVIGKLKKKKTPSGLKALETYIAESMEPINVLDMLADTEYWLNWTRFFGPISGHDAKLENSVERYLTTSFCYGCNLGPTQTARSLGNIDRRQISWINQRHITNEKLDKAIQHIINSYNKFILPKYWGDGKRASADGTKWDLYEQNLLSEHHIRYGGYGGIGYYHVSDTYIALFSHFIPCGVWEGIYILDILMNNKSEIQPEILHADTQGQSATVFGLSSLLGIELMPRIRNWKDLKLFRPSKEGDRYKHIDEIFSDEIDWELIETHYPDMLRVAMSIKAGKITPSTILNKLGTYSKKNKLYQAFRELGRVIRTKFLLTYIADKELRSTIQAATNKSEAFNGFTKWLFFGGEGMIAENDREKQRKIIKFNHLVSNCLIFYNVFSLTRILHEYSQQQDNKFDEELISDLSPYITAHVNRFGKYRLDPNRRPPDLQFDVPLQAI